jgi:hypothetical protein
MQSLGDAVLLERIGRATGAGRSVLCALARRGKALALEDPARAAFLLSSVGRHPLYKVCRLFFDMAEIEDLMLDGPPPDALDDDALAEALRSLRDSIRGVTDVLVEVGGAASTKVEAPSDREAPPAPASTQTPGEAPPPPEPTRPALDASDYLFDLVVIGWLSELADPRKAVPAAGAVEPQP